MLKELIKLVPSNTSNMRVRYGLSEKEFLDLLYGQQGLCAICGVRFTTKLTPCVDHCHTNGHIRGLLCTNCNTGIGLLGENIHIFEQAIIYINKDKYHANHTTNTS